MSTLCVAMCCKNEAPVIVRALESAASIADAWCIVDTGSTDGTQEIVRGWLQGRPHVFLERPWIGWPENFSELLATARPLATHTLVLDADEIAEPGPSFDPHALSADAYMIRAVEPGADFWRAQMVCNRLPWRYMDPLHCWLHADGAGPTARADLILRSPHDGARSRDPDTYRKDAAILEAALKDEPNNARWIFYLAQSYRDCGENEKALAAYTKRSTMGGWIEEVFYSFYQIGAVLERLGRDPTAAYLTAFATQPTRAEPLCELSRYYRQLGLSGSAFVFASAALAMRRPIDALFIDASVYDWRASDEVAITAYFVGKYLLGELQCRTLLNNPHLPASELPRVRANLQHYLDQHY